MSCEIIFCWAARASEKIWSHFGGEPDALKVSYYWTKKGCNSLSKCVSRYASSSEPDKKLGVIATLSTIDRSKRVGSPFSSPTYDIC